jgi:hypothetical protein
VLTPCAPARSALERLDLRQNKISVADFQALVALVENAVLVGTIRAATLAEEPGRRLIPYLVIRTAKKTLTVDMRHNPLFSAGTDPVSKRELFTRVASMLAARGAEEPPSSIVPRDGADDDDEAPREVAPPPPRSPEPSPLAKMQNGRSLRQAGQSSSVVPRASAPAPRSPVRSPSKARGAPRMAWEDQPRSAPRTIGDYGRTDHPRAEVASYARSLGMGSRNVASLPVLPRYMQQTQAHTAAAISATTSASSQTRGRSRLRGALLSGVSVGTPARRSLDHA